MTRDLDATMEGALATLRRDPRHTAVLTDFDGTLAPLVDEPSAARPLPESASLLENLAEHYGLVGVVSGRPLSFLADHLRVPGLWVSGLYGLESMVEGEVMEPLGATQWRAVVATAVAEAGVELAGLLVEDKGLSMTVHFRTAPEREHQAAAWADHMASRSGLEVRRAKASLELHPPLGLDKGSVIEAKVLGHGSIEAVCFLGDDRGDLPAFEALVRLRDRGTRVVRVGVETTDTPEELLGQADVVVEGPAGALAFLAALLP